MENKKKYFYFTEIVFNNNKKKYFFLHIHQENKPEKKLIKCQNVSLALFRRIIKRFYQYNIHELMF